MLLLLLNACGGSDADETASTATGSGSEEAEIAESTTALEATPTAGEDGEGAATAIPPTATPAPTETPVPTETPTPLPAGIELQPYYELDEEGTLLIDAVSMPAEGWLAVYPSTQSEIEADLALGFLPLEAGLTRDVALEIEIEGIIGRTIQVALHNSPTSGSATFSPSNETLLFITTTEVDTPLTQPSIQYTTQSVDAENRFLTIERVQTQSPGWVVVYTPGNDLPLGIAPVKAGENRDVAVPFHLWESDPTVEIHLLEDRGEPGVYEPEEDRPVLIQDEPVVESGEILLPFEIVALDQPAADTVFFNRVVTDQPGFLVIYNDADGDEQIDIAIGFAYIEAGLTENLVVDVNEGAVSDRIYFTQHVDANGDGEFDFPGEDQMRSIDNQIRLFSARTDLGGFIVAADQPIADDTVTIRLVYAVGPSWIALFAADPELPHRPGGEIIGEASIDGGVSIDVAVPITAIEPGVKVFARIHTDNGDPDLFEPARTDWPQQHEGRDIIISFTILE